MGTGLVFSTALPPHQAAAFTPLLTPHSFNHHSKAHWCLLGIALLGQAFGCSLGPYRYGTEKTSLLPQDSSLSPPVLVGGPVPAMDRLEKIVNSPRDTMKQWQKKLFSRRIGPFESTPEATQQDSLLAAMAFLEDNDLHDVVVEVHHHDPFEQWKRLEANPDIHPLWKYTDGAARVGVYAMFPPRVYRFDAYNPYTRTLSINSTNPAAAIYEAAKAKSHALAPWPGAYAAMRYVPLAPVGQQIAVTSDAMGYVQQNADPTIQRAMVSHTLANITGTALLGGSTLTPELSDVPLVSVPASQAIGAATGSIAGRLIRPSQDSDPTGTVPPPAEAALTEDSPVNRRLARTPRRAEDPRQGIGQQSGTIYR